MVFGNTANVVNLKTSTTQQKIYAMRTTRAIPIAEITKRTGLSAEEVKRFNPALVRQVPARATLYLPSYVPEFGQNVSFWHEAPSPEYLAVLNDFVRIEMPIEQWDDRASEPLMREFQQRFKATNTEEGAIMAVALGYAMDEAYTSRRGNILQEFRTSPSIQQLFERGLSELQASRARASVQ
jgi:hypothetical protein